MTTRFTEEHQAARAAVEAALVAFLEVHNRWAIETRDPDDNDDDEQTVTARTKGNPVITAWVAAFEWTNIGLEQDNAAVVDYVASLSQPFSASAGLGHLIINRYT